MIVAIYTAPAISHLEDYFHFCEMVLREIGEKEEGLRKRGARMGWDLKITPLLKK